MYMESMHGGVFLGMGGVWHGVLWVLWHWGGRSIVLGLGREYGIMAEFTILDLGVA